MPKFTSLKNDTLKEILKDHDLPTTGSKNEMITRLIEAIGTDEIDEQTLAQYAPHLIMQKQIDDLKAVVQSLANTVNSQLTLNESNNDRRLAQNNARQEQTTNNQTTNVENTTTDATPQRGMPDASQSGSPQWTYNGNNRFSVKEIAETLPEFDPTDDMSLTVEQFVARVNASNNAHEWNPKGLLLAVHSKLRGAAKLWFDAFEYFSTTWTELQDAMIEEFSQRLDETEIHRKMSAAVRKQNERIEDYCFRIAALGRRFRLSEQSIIKHTRDGLHHRELQAATAAVRFQSVKELRETCMEFLKNQPASRQTPQPQPWVKSTREEPQNPNQRKNEKFKSDAPRETKCYNCFELGHMSASCPKPQRRRRCADCNRVHAVGEATNCGKKPTLSRKVTTGDGIFTKEICIGDTKLIAFIDTGSQCSMIRKTATKGLLHKKERCSLTIQGIGGGIQNLTEQIRTTIRIDQVDIEVVLYVVNDYVIDVDILLGQDIFAEHEQIKAIVENGHLMFKVARAEVSDPILETVKQRMENPEEGERLVRLINTYRECFATGLKEIGKTDLVTMKIELDTEKPISQNPYRVPLPKRETIIGMVDELLEADIIRTSESEYASPVTLTKKPDGSDRFCIDYRRVNEHVRREIYPMPNIEERLQDAKQYKLFTSLDLNSGYYQIEVEESSRRFTAFITTEGLYEFNRMPFGLRNSPMAFLRLMAKLKNMVQPDDMIHYMDDILIGANNNDEMFEKTERVLNAIRQAGLTLNTKKCRFFHSTITFLGHKLTAEGIEPGAVKTTAIGNFKRPATVTEVRRFLGLSGYFRKFVPGYALISEPIRRLLRKGEPFVWSELQEKAFNELKTALTGGPILVAFRLSGNHQLHTDASSIGIAAVLLQEEPDGWKPVAYYSRSTSAGESKMHSYELETLAVVEGLERFRFIYTEKASPL